MIETIKVLFPSTIAFSLGILGAPILTYYLYKYKMWKKTSVQISLDGGVASITQKLHNDEERKVPRMGGVVVWGSVLLTTCLFLLLEYCFPESVFSRLNFLSRNQTWLPFFTLIAGALCGLADDYLVCRGEGTYLGGGLSLGIRLGFVTLLGIFGALWFYFKLDMHTLLIPFLGEIDLGLGFIFLYIFFVLGIYSGGIIDGVDGLSGGVFAAMYMAYAIIAYTQGQIDLAAYCSVVVGALLAFLWFNVPPARFYNSETGTMGLTTSLVVVAFLTRAVIVLPIIALPLVATTLSAILQIASKRFRNGKKIFLVAPLHNHFQAMGWPAPKVTMRYWIVSMITAVVGVVLALLGGV